jgi:uncharacterized membrane protein/uncharacterized protein YegL
MSLTFTAPAALFLLLAVPLVWVARAFARTNFNPRQQLLQAAVRSALLVLLALALARPVISTTSSKQSVVFLVDVSHSISGRAIEDAAARIDELMSTLRPAHSRIVVFGASAKPVENTAALRQLAAIDSSKPDGVGIDRGGTDLEAALDAARAEIAAGYVPRLVLFTDGQSTQGDVEAAVARLAAERIPVSAEPLAPRFIGDTWVDGLELPARLSAGAQFTATVDVGSQRDGPATVELRSGSKVIATRTVALSRGMTNVTLDAAIENAGAQTLTAAVTSPGDPLAINNTLDRAVSVASRPKVLYVEGTPASAHYLASALTESGFDVTVNPAHGLPSDAKGFEPWDAVILSDVSRPTISDASMLALSDWVEKRGGGLLVAGGEAVYGEGGYRKTPIERLTPVTFERRDEPEVALIIVLDRSWSMAGTSIELCKAAAQAAVDVMTDEQSIGILTFNDQFDWDVTLRNVGKNRDFIHSKIAAIEPGGHTLIYPAIEQAYIALRNAKARAKHVILLSDGRSYPDDYEGLVNKMVDQKMTVSSVAVGPAADAELLGDIAKWGKGRAYVVQDPRDVPQIFVKEAKNAATPAFDEKTIKPIIKAPGFLEGLDLAHVPALGGRTATVLKDTALELIATEDDDPLLAFWPVGLGRAAVFASDVKDRWASDWVKWRGYGPFFTSVLRAIERQGPTALAIDVAPGPIRAGTRAVAVSVEARDASGQYRDLLRPMIELRVDGGAPTRIVARQIGPGRYQANLVADATRPLMITVPDGPSGNNSRLIVPDPAAEYRFRPPDVDLLKSIVVATGGAWVPTAATLANSSGDHRTDRRPLWPWLLGLALCLWFVDLLFRRIRVFEPRADSQAALPGLPRAGVVSHR